MNKQQHKALAGLVKKDGLSGINADFTLYKSSLFPTSVIAKFIEIVTSEDGGVFDETKFYEIQDNGNVNAEIDKEMDINGRALFRKSLTEIQ